MLDLQNKVVDLLTQIWTCSDYTASHWLTCCLSDSLSWQCYCVVVVFLHKTTNFLTDLQLIWKNSAGLRQPKWSVWDVKHSSSRLTVPGFHYDMWKIFLLYIFVWIWRCEMQQLNIQQMVNLWPRLVRVYELTADWEARWNIFCTEFISWIITLLKTLKMLESYWIDELYFPKNVPWFN